ncbi:hypothetical protein ACP275_04G058600 [Erythranthe tilingii]
MAASRTAFFTVFAVLCLLAAAARAEESLSSPAPAPGPNSGAVFATSSSGAFICFSVVLSFAGLFLQ